MTDPDAFERWSLGGTDGAPPHEILAEAGRLLDAAAEAGQPTLIELEGGFLVGWHKLPGRFRVAPRVPGAPEDLPAWLAALEDARHVHVGADRPEAAIQALIALVRETSGKL